jgi:hypothetical protein
LIILLSELGKVHEADAVERLGGWLGAVGAPKAEMGHGTGGNVIDHVGPSTRHAGSPRWLAKNIAGR